MTVISVFEHGERDSKGSKRGCSHVAGGSLATGDVTMDRKPKLQRLWPTWQAYRWLGHRICSRAAQGTWRKPLMMTYRLNKAREGCYVEGDMVCSVWSEIIWTNVMDVRNSDWIIWLVRWRVIPTNRTGKGLDHYSWDVNVDVNGIYPCARTQVNWRKEHSNN